MPHDYRRDFRTVTVAALVLAGGALGWPDVAGAQTSGSLTLASAYDARGVVLSSHPVAQLRIEHDSDNGWYAGGFASPVMLGRAPTQAELIVYGGFARQLASGLSWDAGLSRTSFLRDTGYSYSEIYAGLATDNASARLFLSPDYFGGGRSAYLDLSAFHPLTDKLRLTAHAGLKHAFGAYYGDGRDRIDLRAGLALDLGHWTLQASVGSLQKSRGYEYARARQFLFSASMHF